MNYAFQYIIIVAIVSMSMWGCTSKRATANPDGIIEFSGSKNLDYDMVMAIQDVEQRFKYLLKLKSLWMPGVDGYEDAVHIRYYRKVHYQIVRYGPAIGDHIAADESLEWLMDTDQDIK